jgi:hypothetical protein
MVENISHCLFSKNLVYGGRSSAIIWFLLLLPPLCYNVFLFFLLFFILCNDKGISFRVRKTYITYSGFGQPVNWIAADILRIEDGILVEHWDVIQDEATQEQSKSGLPMFGDKFPE